MKKIKCVMSLLLFFIFLDCILAIRWLSLQHSTLRWNFSSLTPPASNHHSGREKSRIHPALCSVARRRYGFAKSQAKLCRRTNSTREILGHIQKAALVTAETCQNVFRQRRWNCSSVKSAPYLTPDLTRATKEQAYVYAISSAALTHTLARGCASGTLSQCTCAPHPQEAPRNFHWGGCGDNIRWAIDFAKRFVDNVEKSIANQMKNKRGHKALDDSLTDNEIAMVNLHNNKIGRKIIQESLQLQCKCHGVSGSCSIKTCWRGLPSMVEIGKRLYKRYANAIKIAQNYVEGNLGKKKVSEQLLYLSKSPDYCTPDVRLGSVGTKGRHCNVTSAGSDSCRHLCCGRGYRTLVEEKLERCNCKYYSCCYVKCGLCKTRSQIYECG